MNKIESQQYEDEMISWPVDEVERRISNLTDRSNKAAELSAEIGTNPIMALRKIKQRQLDEAMAGYGKVDLSLLAIDRIPMVFAKLQADESAARKDLKTFDQIDGCGKDLKKQLEIAKRVLAQKTSTGGRK